MSGIPVQLPKIITDKYSVVNNSFKQVVKDNPKDLISLEIGDSKQLEFIPQIKICRWDNECNVSIRLKDLETGVEKVETKDEKIVWSKGNLEANFYSLEGMDHPEGAYEFEVILNKKPLTNKIEFTLETKGLDFFYQPELTQEEIDQGASRPENVIGSYAVYASENKINYVDGKEYKVGKVGHIFRPKIIDAVGTEVWGELNIADGILSVTIPQDFLDNAVYPVRHAAGLTFGYTSAGLSYETRGKNWMASYRGDLVEAGVTVSMSMYICNSTSTTGYNAQFAIYDISSPANRKDYTGSVALGNATPSWKTANLAGVSLSVATYHLAFNHSSSDNARCYYDAGSSVSNLNGSQTFGTWLSTWNTFVSHTSKYSIYCTYTAAGGGFLPRLGLLHVG